MKFTRVLDKLPEPDRRKRYFVQTEEGYIWLQPYDPPRNAEPGNPLSWYDTEHDSGYIIAWADPGELKNDDWAEHSTRFRDAQEEDW